MIGLRVAAATAAFVVACNGGGPRAPGSAVYQGQRAVTLGPGPGLGNLTYAASELFQTVGLVIDDPGTTGGHGNVAMVKGYLATIYTSDGGGSNGSFAFWDVSNPRAPVRVHDYRRPAVSKLREPHGFGFTTGYGGSYYLFAQSTAGFQIWDWTNPAAATLVQDVVLPGAGAGDYTGVWWVHLQAPYVYVAGGSAGLYVVDASNVNNPVVVKQMTNAALGIARINQVHVVGNLMIVNYVENGTGTSLLDISDPANPVKKFTDTANPPTPYSTLFNGGKLASAGKQSLKLSMFDVTFNASKDPAGLVRYGVDTGTGLGGGGYLSFQDGFINAGFSSVFAKFDTRALPLAQLGTGDPGPPYDGDLDFGTTLGNLVMVGNDHGGGSALMVHQLEPDLTGPAVTFVNPLDGSVSRNVKSRVGLTFSDAVNLDTIDDTSVIVRPFGGAPLRGKYSAQGGTVNFFPDAALKATTTYEVVVPAGGVRDWAGNPVTTAFSSRFSTGTKISFGPEGCALGPDTPAVVGAAVNFVATGCTGSPPLTYSWSFGDGSPDSPFATTASATHAYAAPLHHGVTLTVKDGQGVAATFNRRQTVTYPATASKPTRSSTIVVDTARGRVSVVNSDAGTVASLDSAPPFTKRWEVPVGRNPRTLAQPAPGGDLWVVNQDDATISVRDGGTGASRATIALPLSSRPYGIAFDPTGARAYLTLEGTGRLLRIEAATRVVSGDADVGPRPRGVAVSHDGARVLVTRFISPDAGGEVREVSGGGGAFALVRTLVLPEDTTTVSSESDGPGLPNYVQAVTITPDGRGAWIPSKKDNIRRGTGPTSDGIPFIFDARVRTIVSKLDLVANVADVGRRKDINNADLANAVVFTDLGDWAFVSTQGGNRIEVYDALSHEAIATIGDTGLAPRGVALSGGRLFVQNFMSRDLAVYDVSAVGGSNVFPRLATVSTQASEPLAPQVLQGKKIFYNAADPRLSREAYTSCASCHLDGDSDGRVWDFTQFGEGVRNTASLLGRGGVAEQGPVHWTGNFDEIQDFENDIRGAAFGGEGFMSDPDFAATADPLGAPKAGRSADLDALAAYVSSLTTAPPSPFRNPADGTMTAEALAGKALFESPAVGCAGCHSGAEKTDSQLGLLHDVGTLTAASGQRAGQPLVGLDTPTLLGAWATAPYLHDGSAATLMEVITTRNAGDRHGTTSFLGEAERSQLVAYLQQLDDPPVVPLQVTIDFVSSGRSYTTATAQVGATYLIDQGFVISALSAALLDGRLIRTAEADRNLTTATHLRFTVNKPVTVYVGYDRRTTTNPAWLAGWTVAAETWTTSNGNASPFKVFRRSFPAGSITLGANRQSPGAGMRSQYSVIVRSP